MRRGSNAALSLSSSALSRSRTPNIDRDRSATDPSSERILVSRWIHSNSRATRRNCSFAAQKGIFARSPPAHASRMMRPRTTHFATHVDARSSLRARLARRRKSKSPRRTIPQTRKRTVRFAARRFSSGRARHEKSKEETRTHAAQQTRGTRRADSHRMQRTNHAQRRVTPTDKKAEPTRVSGAAC